MEQLIVQKAKDGSGDGTRLPCSLLDLFKAIPLFGENRSIGFALHPNSQAAKIFYAAFRAIERMVE